MSMQLKDHSNPYAQQAESASADSPPSADVVEECDAPVPAKLAEFEAPPMWSSREFESSKMELMSIAAKSTGTAYFLWFIGGLGGFHRFYMGKFGSGVAMWLLMALSALTMIILIGFIGLFAAVIWWLVDAVCIGGWVKKHNERVACLVADVASNRG